MQEIFNFFPVKISKKINEYINGQVDKELNQIEEIRFRNNNPIILKYNNKEQVLQEYTNSNDILEIMQRICNNSIYSYQNQICNGYITIKGGHRVGITGNCVIENNKVININYISSLNFRIARQVLGCSNKILKYVLNIENKSIYNTIIVSPPGVGKTTLLRDLIRNISTGIEEINFPGLNVGVVDERGEIASLYRGISQNNIGTRTDILDNIPKVLGMKMLIRSMSPQVICADEIGNSGDSEIIKEAFCSGIKGIFTAHGSTFKDILKNPILKELLETNIIEKIIILDTQGEKGKIKSIYELIEENYKEAK